MVPMINAQTGTLMYVHESRLEEYLSRGHKLADPPAPPAKKPRASKRKTETGERSE